MRDAPVEPLFRYSDVSRDPEARERTNIGPRTQADLRDLGFEPIGHVCGEYETCVLLDEVWRSADGRTLASVSTSNSGDLTTFKSLLRDGTIVVTKGKTPGVWGLLIAHGVPPSPASGYHWATSKKSTLAGLLADHEQNLARHAREAGADVFCDNDLASYLGMRLRYRDMADPAHFIQRAVGATVFRFSLPIAAACLVVIGTLVARKRIHPIDFAVSLLLVSALVSAAYLFGLLIWGPVVARRQPVTRVDLDTLLERGRRVPVRRLPERARDFPIAPPALELPLERLRQLERRDAILSAVNAAATPLAVAALSAIYGAVGLLLAIGIDLSVSGAIALRLRQTRLGVLREVFVRELLDAEPACASGACTLSSSWMAWTQVGVGVGLLWMALRARIAGVVKPISASMIAVLVAIAFIAAALAAFAAHRRHRAARNTHVTRI